MAKEIRSALLVFVALTLVTGVVYPAVTTLIGTLAFHDRSQRQRDRGRRPSRRIAPDRPAVLGREVLLEPAVGDEPAAVQRRGLERLEPRADQPGARDGGQRPDRRAASGGSGQSRADSGRSRDGVGQRARSAHLVRPPPSTKSRASRASAA